MAQAAAIKNLPLATMWQALAGAVIAIGLIVLWMSLYPSDQSKLPADLIFDSEVITLPASNSSSETVQPQPDKSADVPTPPQETMEDIMAAQLADNKASAYPFFARFKAPINSEQRAAIANGQPVLSLIISDIGKSRNMVELIRDKLSNNITLSMSPYAEAHNLHADALSGYGFEIWMDAAAITYDMNHDHGPLALNPVNEFARNISMLAEQLDNKDKVTGVILPSQSLIIETQDLWADIVNDLYAEGYGILDNTAQVMKPSLFFYDDKRAPYLKGDITLNDDLTLEQLEQALANLRKSVLEQGTLIATMPLPTPAGLDILAEWVNSLEADGIFLVPLSAQVKL